MTAPRIAGFSIVRNATLLDFPLEASIASVLPAVDEFVLAVGRSDDDTHDRARAMAERDARIQLVDTVWDFSLGSLVLSQQTDVAMHACQGDWGIYIQADEVIADGGAEKLRDKIRAVHEDAHIEGLVAEYLHFYGSFDQVGTSRRWYRREVRAVRLNRDIHSYGDAQGFRVGPSQRRVRCARSGVTYFHYSSARPSWVLKAKREQDRAIYQTEQRKDSARPLLPWAPGLRAFTGGHPAVVQDWVNDRRGSSTYVEPRHFQRGHIREWITLIIERLTGWRPFEFRNYTLSQ